MEGHQDVPDDQRKYLDDLETIRGLMTRYEEQSLVRPWVFAVWGGLVLAGTILSLQLSQSGEEMTQVLLLVWLPVQIVAGAAEALGWFLQTRRTGTAIFTRRMNRLLATYGGIIVIVVILVLHMAPTGLSVGVVLALGALPLLAYAQMTFASLYLEAFALLIAAIVGDIWVSDLPGTMSTAGIVVGALYIVSGVHSSIEERRAARRARDSGDDG